MTRLEEIEARANAATAGPWSETDDYIQKVEPPWSASHDAIAHDVMRDEDRIFIAHARSDIPWLLARIKALEKVAVAAFAWRDDSSPVGCGLATEEDLTDAVDAYRSQYPEPE